MLLNSTTVKADVPGAIGSWSTIGTPAPQRNATKNRVKVEILRRFVEQVEADSLRGSILIIPVENPPAFESGTRNTPIDMLNLNRCFPGKPEGFITEKMTHVMSQKFFPNVDYLIDLHAGTADFTVDYTYIVNDEDFAKAHPEGRC